MISVAAGDSPAQRPRSAPRTVHVRGVGVSGGGERVGTAPGIRAHGFNAALCLSHMMMVRILSTLPPPLRASLQPH